MGWQVPLRRRNHLLRRKANGCHHKSLCPLKTVTLDCGLLNFRNFGLAAERRLRLHLGLLARLLHHLLHILLVGRILHGLLQLLLVSRILHHLLHLLLVSRILHGLL